MLVQIRVPEVHAWLSEHRLPRQYVAYAPGVARLFHVSSAANRDSILAYGLDCTRMGAAPGIAGSMAPEVDGIFLCADESEAEFFIRMNNTGGPVDVWAVTGIDQRQLIDASSGFSYYPAPIPVSQITLVGRPRAPRRPINREHAEDLPRTTSPGTRIRIAPTLRA